MLKWIGGATLFVALILAFGCRKEDRILTDGDAMLRFSTDTLRFDTVFTQLGSATRILKLYNDYDQPVSIEKIELTAGSSSKFRINVDGLPGEAFEDIRIEANDSIYVFAEVTVDPDAPLSESPFVITESLQFQLNGNDQSVVLEAWGQNANYVPSRFNAGGLALLSCDFGEVTWDDPKPYVIYGILLIDSCTLNLPPGTRLYVHGGVAQTVDQEGNPSVYNDGLIYVLPDGRLRSQGTLDDPVVIQGDRLEEPFQDEEGQWVGVRFASDDNELNFTEIKNSLFGVVADSASAVRLTNSRIFNTAGPGIFGQHARIEAENCLVYNNGSTSVQISYGGDYEFTNCTIASYGVDAGAISLSNGICYDLLCSEFDIYRLNATLTNCIFSGSRTDEISLSDFTSGMQPSFFNVTFDHCLVRVEDLLDPEQGGYPDFFTEYCFNCIPGNNIDPLFVDANQDDYHLDSLSVAIGQGIPVPGLSLDLEGVARDPMNPDLGCFEWAPE